MREYPRKRLSRKTHWKIKCLIIQRWFRPILLMSSQVSMQISEFPVLRKAVLSFWKWCRMRKMERLIWLLQNPYHGLPEIPQLFWKLPESWRNEMSVFFLNCKTSIRLRKRENCCLPYWQHLHKQKVNLQVRVPRWLIYTVLRMAKS